jgi:hypothetical protein
VTPDDTPDTGSRNWPGEMERPEATRPLTYQDAQAAYRGTHDAINRFHDLAGRELLARAVEQLRARGEYDPAKYGPGEEEPLTTAEHLELLATGEMLARHYRHPARVHDAVKAGATWEQIGAARGTSADGTRQDYRQWAASQHWLYAEYEGKFGMNDTEYATAIERTGLTEAGCGGATTATLSESGTRAQTLPQAGTASDQPAPLATAQRQMEAGQ